MIDARQMVQIVVTWFTTQRMSRSAPVSLVYSDGRPFSAFCISVFCNAWPRTGPLAVAAGLAALAAMLHAGRADAAYKVTIDAPRSIRSLLSDNLDLVRYKDRPNVTSGQLDYMVRTAADQVRQLTATEGYFDPKTTIARHGSIAASTATIASETDAKENELALTITVEPGLRTLIRQADLTFSGPVSQMLPGQVSTIKDNWQLKADQPFRQSDWDSGKGHGLQTLQSHYFAAAKIASSSAAIDALEHQADLDVEYDSGPAFTLGELQITGTKKYPADIIRHVNPLQPGEPYDVNRLLLLQRQIQSTPYFGNVIVGIDDDPEHAVKAPVRVQVTELPTQLIRTGVGYSTDTGANVTGRYSHYNVFGKAWVFDAQAKIEQRRKSGVLDLAMPPDSNAYVNHGLVSYQRDTLDGVDLTTFRTGLRRDRKFDNYTTGFSVLYYRDLLKQLSGDDVPPAAVISPDSQQAVVFGFDWSRIRVDDQIFPRSGNIVNASFGVAFKGLATNQSFARADVRVKQYFPVGRHDLVLLRAEVGALAAQGPGLNVPASLLFRAGGTETIRGYGYLSIGNKQDGTVYPASYMIIGSAEYQHWFNDTWGAATFLDSGTVTNNWHDRNFRSGVGGGIRYRTPVGSINLDLGYGIQARQYRPHISLGVAF